MEYLIDTDVVIEFLAGDANATALIASLLPSDIAISIITYTELYEGIYVSRDPVDAERTFRKFLRGTTVLGVSRTVAKQHARLRGELRPQKRQVNHRAMDLLIAATALTHDLTLVTYNKRDYIDIVGLKIL